MRFIYFLLFSCLSTFLACQKGDITPVDSYWNTEDPALHHFDVDTLSAALAAAGLLPNFYAVLVARDGKLVAEKYYNGKKAHDLFHLRSITKNITSALTGIALSEGYLDSVDVSIKSYFPGQINGEKEAITIRHLLNMTSGLTWDENKEINGLIDHKIPDPLDYLLSRELSDAPGSTFNYNSLSPHVIARILTEETGKSLPALATENLFRPLGIERYEWLTDPQGAAWGGLGLQLTARDLAKFGQLYLNEGNWEGRRLIPASWVRQSAEAQIETYSPTSGYSFLWWTSRNQGTPIYYGQGYGGQALMLIPEKNLLVVAFQEYYVPSEQSALQWKNFVEKVFLPVFRAAK